MQYVLFITNKLNLLVRKFASKFFRNKIISQFDHKKISINKKKSREETNTREKSVRSINVIKIMQATNILSTNILMFCDKKSENKSLELSHFKISKNIRSLSTFLFLNVYFNVYFVKYYTIRFKITIVKQTNIIFKI